MNPTIIPTLRYHDAQSAIKWLCDAFGFKEHLVVLGDNGRIEHAQLTFGNGMILLGSARDDDFGRLQAPPSSSNAVLCQSPYIIVRAIDEHYRDAANAGAIIVMPLTAEDYGGKNYSCRDPEGYLWNFGNYDPWRPLSQAVSWSTWSLTPPWSAISGWRTANDQLLIKSNARFAPDRDDPGT